jgi:hypothetical protein
VKPTLIADLGEGHDYVNVTLQSPIHSHDGFDDPFPAEFPRLPPKPVSALPPKPPASIDSIEMSILDQVSIYFISVPDKKSSTNSYLD